MSTTEREMLTVTIDAEALRWLEGIAEAWRQTGEDNHGDGDRALEALNNALPEPSR